MGLHLTTEDVARCEAASRVMLSPLSAASIDDWRREVNRVVRDLFAADKTVFLLPGGLNLFFSEDAPSLASGVEDYVAAYATDGIHLKDPIVDQWQHMRRAEGVDVFTWSVNERMIGRIGHSMKDSEMVSGVIASHGVEDFTGTYVTTPVGEVLLWMLYDDREKHRFGEGSVSVLRALLPSFKAGLDALIRLDAQRVALDQFAEPMTVLSADRREIHRNRALAALYDADPESEKIRIEVVRLGTAVLVVGPPGSGSGSPYADSTPGGSPFVPALRSVSTSRDRYDLKGTMLPPGAFGNDPTVLVTVTRVGAPELPTPDALRDRYGITKREAEVALLVARGLSNDDIADALFLSPHTARRHTANLFEKLGVNSRKALALKFLGDGRTR